MKNSVLMLPIAVAALTAGVLVAPGAAAQSGEGSLDGGSLGGSSESLEEMLPSGSLGSSTGTEFDEYVALGDSYAAVGNMNAPTTGPEDCYRSTTNYPSGVAADDSVATVNDVTCSGATTEHMSARQHPVTPPQLDALTPETDLVTLSIGGNDIMFGEIVGCAITNMLEPENAPCSESIGPEVVAAMDALVPQLETVYSEIEQRSPDATVVATQYMPLLPAVPGTCVFARMLQPADFDWMNELTADLNRLVDDAAEAAGHTSVMPLSPGTDRSACAAQEEAWTSFLGHETESMPMHPTALGQQAMAGAVLAEL